MLLRENAFDDLSALSAIEAVVLRGRYLDRGDLDGILASLEDAGGLNSGSAGLVSP